MSINGQGNDMTNHQQVRRTYWMIVCGLAVVVGLYAEELVHYKHALVGLREHYVTRNLYRHPGCSLRNNNPRELVCPIEGYNTIRLGCLTNQCTLEDQDALEITDARVEAYRQRWMTEFGQMPAIEHYWDEAPTDISRTKE